MTILEFLFPFSRRRVSMVRHEYDSANKILTVTYSNGVIEQFHGSSTVWHKLPFLDRCSTFTESTLSDYYAYWDYWRGPYPDAHKKNKK